MATKLHVSNLAPRTTAVTLRALFEGNGRQVDRVGVATDHDTGEPRGFALVQMTTAEDAEAAIDALNGREVDGHALTVRVARIKSAAAGARANVDRR